MGELESQIEKVKEARYRNSLSTETIRMAKERFMREEESVFATAARCAKELAEEEAKRRELTLAAYELTGSKKPALGVGIRIMKSLDYEECQAIEWAVESGAGNCLKLDKKNFEKAAEALALDFVTINDVAQATISKEL